MALRYVRYHVRQSIAEILKVYQPCLWYNIQCVEEDM